MGNEELQPLEILDVPSTGIEDEEVTFDSLWNMLLAHEDIIITIDEESVEETKRGLSVVKNNYNKRLEKGGNKKEDRILKYLVVETLEDTDPKQVRLQIWLAKKSSVHVHRIVVPEKGL